MIDIEKYINELENDFKIDELNIKDVQMKLPGTKHKWAGRYIRHKIELNKLKEKRGALIVELGKKVAEESSLRLNTSVAEKMAEKRPEVAAINKEIEELEIVLELLEKAETTFKSMTYDLGNIVKIIQTETM